MRVPILLLAFVVLSFVCLDLHLQLGFRYIEHVSSCFGLGKLNCLNQDKAVELLGGATREKERGWKEEERRGHTAMASLSHS